MTRPVARLWPRTYSRVEQKVKWYGQPAMPVADLSQSVSVPLATIFLVLGAAFGAGYTYSDARSRATYRDVPIELIAGFRGAVLGVVAGGLAYCAVLLVLAVV